MAGRQAAPSLTTAQADRAAGVLLGLACGDALGAPYEFGPARISGEPVAMTGGCPFGWEPGEWTDDTSMAVAIAETSATGDGLRSGSALDKITLRFTRWRSEAKDVGNQIGSVLSRIRDDPRADAAARAARGHFERTGGEGNGSLMRTAPVALAYLADPAGLTEAAHAVSALTHAGPQAREACALWCHAIRHAVLHGTFDGLHAAVEHLPADRAAFWSARLAEAEATPPHEIGRNGWVVRALMTAWSAIIHTPIPADSPRDGKFPGLHLQHAIETAVRAGEDTDTVAAIAGSLLGARWGVSAIPFVWRRAVHGWPGLRARDLTRLGLLTARGGRPDPQGYPSVTIFDYSGYGDTSMLARHPSDPGVWLSGIDALRHLPPGVDAVVSLCRLGTDEVPAQRPGGAGQIDPGDHLEVWLIDSGDRHANPNLALVDAADTVAVLRAEGRQVLIHCVQARSRTPAVAALYAARHRGIPLDHALRDIKDVLPLADPNGTYQKSLHRLTRHQTA